MRKLTDFIVKKRYVFLSLFIIVAVFSLYLSTKVSINEDIMKYLPLTSETKIGKDIMDEEFSEQDSSILNVMFKGLTDTKKEETLKKLENIDGVNSIQYENTDEYNTNKYTLYVLNVNDYSYSKTATDVYNYVKDNFKTAGMSGSIYDENKPILQLWIVIVAIVCAMIILIILSDSYVEPWLYLISIGIAVFINKGTNIMFDSVSSITNSIVAILQLALSMDYSIMLSNRYKQEKMTHTNKIEAMKEALYQSFKSISSSSITTIVGLVALVFMSFTIGKDLGFVLAKGVLLSLVSIFFYLPALLLIFDNLIAKTKKKSPKFNLTKLGIIIYKTRYIQVAFIVALFIVAYLLKGNIGILYTGSEQDKVSKIFPATNQVAIVYNNKYEELISSYCKKLESDEKIDQVLCYSNTINEKLAYNELNKKFEDLGQDTNIDEYLIKIIYYNFYNQDTSNKMTLNEFISFIKSDIYTNENFNDSLNQDTKDNLDLLENFTTASQINKKRTTKEIASILGMNKEDADNILIYYNSKNIDTKMTMKQFVDFMLNDVAKDKTYASSLDNETISQLKKLQKFTNIENIIKKLNAKELAEMFGMKENQLEQLLLFSRIKAQSNSKLTFHEFATTALDLANNKDYQHLFDKNTIDSLTVLKELSDEANISKKMGIEKMNKSLANYGLEIDTSTLSLLYTLYDGYNTNTKLTFNEFANIALGLANTKDYSSMFDPKTIKTLSILKYLADENNISIKMPAQNMSKMLNSLGLNIDENTVSLLYILENGYNSETKMTLNQFATTALSIAQEEEYKNYFKEDIIASLEKIVYLNKVKAKPMSKNELYELFDIRVDILQDFDEELTPINFVKTLLGNEQIQQNQEMVNNLSYALFIMSDTTKYLTKDLATTLNQDILVVSAVYGLSDAQTGKSENLSIKELINFIDKNKTSDILVPYIKNNTKLLNLASVIVNNTTTKYSMSSLASILGQDKLVVSAIFGFSDYNNSILKNISIKELINFIYANRNNSLFKDYLKDNNDLDLAYKVINNTSTKYSYIEISNITGVDKSQAKQIFNVYDYQNYETLLSPLELTDLILNNLEDEQLKGKLDNNSLKQLNIVKKVMVNTMNNTKVSASYVSDLLDTDKDNVKLLFSLYNFKYIKSNLKISVYNYINFIIKDVMNNKDFASKFDNETKDKLTTISSIMTKALNNKKYNSLDLYGTLRVLNKDLDNSIVELVYLYNNSINNYDDTWKMTIEQLINYLYFDILNDERFNEFLDEEMRDTISSAKKTIDKSKELIVSDKYSRVVLNTKYAFEDEDTYKFINRVQDEIGSNDDIYVVGNSPMAIEMSKTFGDELNKITILTMIFIFIVIAITFKNLIIPFVLVLIIQTAVYLTMSAISITGGSVYFISLLIVQAILMGATIDYAIVYTSYYKESRLTMGVKDSVINAYNKSIHTIISSSSILIIVTLVVARFASAIAAKICETISQGTFASAILILFVLPGVLATTDKFICKKKYYKETKK